MSVAIPLRFFDRNQGEKLRTRLEVESSQFSLTAARNQVISDVDQAYLAVEIAESQARRYRDRYLDEAGRVRDNLQFSYRNGNSTLLDYLDALRDYTLNPSQQPHRRRAGSGSPFTSSATSQTTDIIP